VIKWRLYSTPEYDDIKKHWDSLSKNEDSYKASWDDFYMLQREMEETSRHIQGVEEIKDTGCNDGYCDFQLLSLFKKLKITGIDYSEKTDLQWIGAPRVSDGQYPE
jgi:hypothetical protein